MLKSLDSDLLLDASIVIATVCAVLAIAIVLKKAVHRQAWFNAVAKRLDKNEPG